MVSYNLLEKRKISIYFVSAIVGNLEDSTNMERLRAEGITHIINTVEHNCMVTGNNNNNVFFYFIWLSFLLFLLFFSLFRFTCYFTLFSIYFLLLLFFSQTDRWLTNLRWAHKTSRWSLFPFHLIFFLQARIYTERISNTTVSSRKTTNDTL